MKYSIVLVLIFLGGGYWGYKSWKLNQSSLSLNTRISNYKANPHPATPADASISRGFRANDEKIEQCYTYAKSVNPNLKNIAIDIEVLFTVDQDGKVSEFEIYQPNPAYEEINNCLKKLIESIAFAPVKIGMPKMVSETFYFGP
jgi:hypothetical protein